MRKPSWQWPKMNVEEEYKNRKSMNDDSYWYFPKSSVLQFWDFSETVL